MLKRIGEGLRWLAHEFGAAAWDVIKLPFWLLGLGFRRLAALGWRRLALLGVAAVIVTVVRFHGHDSGDLAARLLPVVPRDASLL